MDSFEIKTNPEISWIENRNGLWYIQAVNVLPTFRNTVLITGIGQSGVTLRGLLNISQEEMDRLAVEWLKRRAEIEGSVVTVVLPQEAWSTLWETLQMDADSSAFDHDLRKNISDALDQVSEFNSDVGVEDE